MGGLGWVRGAGRRWAGRQAKWQWGRGRPGLGRQAVKVKKEFLHLARFTTIHSKGSILTTCGGDLLMTVTTNSLSQKREEGKEEGRRRDRMDLCTPTNCLAFPSHSPLSPCLPFVNLFISFYSLLGKHRGNIFGTFIFTFWCWTSLWRRGENRNTSLKTSFSNLHTGQGGWHFLFFFPSLLFSDNFGCFCRGKIGKGIHILAFPSISFSVSLPNSYLYCFWT